MWQNGYMSIWIFFFQLIVILKLKNDFVLAAGEKQTMIWRKS